MRLMAWQGQYATLAKKEGNYALKKEKQERYDKKPEMAMDSAREAKIAFGFSAYKRKIAEQASKKLRKR